MRSKQEQIMISLKDYLFEDKDKEIINYLYQANRTSMHSLRKHILTRTKEYKG